MDSIALSSLSFFAILLAILLPHASPATTTDVSTRKQLVSCFIPGGRKRRRPSVKVGSAFLQKRIKQGAVSNSRHCQHLASIPLPKIENPLSPATFAGKVERELLSKFNKNTTAIQRVLDSWRLAEIGYEHHEFVGSIQSPPYQTNNAQTSSCHQHAPSYVPGLTVQTFWDITSFDWTSKLASSYEEIYKEFQSVSSELQTGIKQGNNIWASALTEDASSYGQGWKTLVLLNRGRWDETNVKLFPKTTKAIYDSGIPVVEAFFASMKPGSDIKLHSDFTNFVLTSHLPLIVPDNGHNKCRLTVGDETRQWIEGQMMLFDTSILHSAINESNETRYILMFRVWHPDLTPIEREALQFIYDSLEVPDLVDDDPGKRFLAETICQSSKAIPDIIYSNEEKKNKKKGGTKKKRTTTSKRGAGFG